jgi:hypothetical protein
MPHGFGRADTYLGLELARLDVGPLRACYLVPDHDRRRLMEAITAASRRWGGVTEPMLAVGPDGFTDQRWQRVVAALAPELFVDIGLDEQARTAAAAQLGKSLTSWADFAGEAPKFPWLWCHPLVIDWPAGDDPVPVPADASLRALAGAGAVENFPMWNVYGPGIAQNADEHRCVLAQLTRGTAIWATARAVTEEAAGSVLAPPAPAVIWVSEPDSFADAIGFWNARALVATITASTTPVTAVLLPPDITAWTDLAALLVPRFQLQFRRPRPDAFIFSHSVPQEQLHEIAAQLNPAETVPAVAQEHAAPGSLGTEPDPGTALTAAVGLDPTPWCCYPRRYGRGSSELVQVFAGQTVTRTPSPVPFRVGTGGWVQVSLSGLRAFAAPPRPAVARLFTDDAWFSGGRLCMKRATMNRYELAVTVPEPSSVLSAALADKGVTFTLSDKGKYAQALLARAPGLEELVRQPGALEVIADLTRKRNDRFRKELEKLLQGKTGDTAPVDDILALARETVPLPHQPAAEMPKHELATPGIAGILEQLVALGMCSRGFSIACAECQMESYVEHSAVTARATCPGCGASGAYRAAASRPAGPVIRYRLNSLLDRANDQGAPAHILGLACLRDYAGSRPWHVVPGADLYDDAGTQVGELDLLGYMGEHLVAGEVKTSPADFTEEQVTKDLSLAARIGADIYVMVAVYALTSAQEGMAATLAAAQGCQLRTFCGDTARPAVLP